jgi:hypothetical protein
VTGVAFLLISCQILNHGEFAGGMGSSLHFDGAAAQGSATVHDVTADDDEDEQAGGEPGGPGVGGEPGGPGGPGVGGDADDDGDAGGGRGGGGAAADPRWNAWETSPGHVA